jgi:erythronate-4-phosphate dehydrogenase
MKVFGDENIVYLKEILSPYCQYTQYSGRNLTQIDLINSGCEILFTRSQTKINEELLKGTIVKVVATATSGTDHFDLEYLEKSKIDYYDAKGSNANSVAEYVIFSMIYWASLNKKSLKNLTIGIVGFGSIGKLVANYANSLGMTILVNDPPLFENGFTFPDYCQHSDLDDLICKSNVLTNHIPLTYNCKYSTFQLFNMDNMINNKNDSLVIHTSRGKVFDENTLNYLVESKNSSVVIDVWENEPDFNIELAKKSLIATPHIAGYSHNGKLNGTLMMLDIFEKYAKINVDKELINNDLNKYIKNIIPEFVSNTELMNSIDERRKIIEDYSKICNLYYLSNPDKCLEFDKQRKTYPIKYELLRPVI